MVSQSSLDLLWCCVSAAVAYVHSLYEIALDYIIIEHSCCFCQVELVTTCQAVTIRTVLLVDHIFLLILMHLYYVLILLPVYRFTLLYVDTLS